MNAIQKNKVCVYCGNGGDYEFERDRHYWRLWLDNNMSNQKCVILPHDEADKAWIIFEAGFNVSFFKLTAPEFISFKDVEKWISIT